MDRLKGKVAIITGASMGLGEADARLFVAEGADVIITDVADKQGHALADELGCHFMHQDVRDEKRWKEVLDETALEKGAIAMAAKCAELPSQAYSQMKFDLRKDFIDRIEASLVS